MNGARPSAALVSTLLRRMAIIAVMSGSLTAASKASNTVQAAAKPEPRPLSERTVKEILANYAFVADFAQHPSERSVSDEIFWRYPLIIPKIEFPIEASIKDASLEMPATKGEGRAIDHLNRGRVLYLDGKIAEAKNTWLAGRARFGKEYPFHRRNDYFIATAFANLALKDQQDKGDWEDAAVKGAFSNAATFLSWAFIVKADQPDPLVEATTPKGLYNLAAIYWRYGRFAGAFGAADTGLNFLRKTGRSDYRSQFYRITAEAHIRNRTYLEAVQALDVAIRQDDDLPQAAASFARAGDIYFDLNNYDLAEDAYALGARIDEEMQQINPAQLVLRGESLFWLGRFSEAQKILHFALEGASFRRVSAPLPDDYAAWAALRIADSYLALKELEKAKLEYYKVAHRYRKSLASRVARVREACLELPYYRGNNVKHARALLEEAKSLEPNGDLPPVVQEIAWACQVGSYTARERSPDMLERVRAFAVAYPESRFLQEFVDPVRDFQATKIEPYVKAGDHYRTVSFFEKNRKLLYPKIPSELAAQMFVSYVDVSRSSSASEFWQAYDQEAADSDLKALRMAVVAAEMASRKDAAALWQDRDRRNAQILKKRAWALQPNDLALGYVNRILNTKTSTQHLPWLQVLARSWGEIDFQYHCDLEYPLLSKIFEKFPEKAGFVLSRISDVIQSQLPELFKSDESCALSLLELEARVLKPRTKELANRYLARKDWPLVGGFLHLYWTISEHLNDDGDGVSARLMWEIVRDKGPPTSPEVKFARSRLDGTKTEFEKLWD